MAGDGSKSGGLVGCRSVLCHGGWRIERENRDKIE